MDTSTPRLGEAGVRLLLGFRAPGTSSIHLRSLLLGRVIFCTSQAVL